MSEDVYMLKYRKSEKILKKLNATLGYSSFKNALKEINYVHGKEDVIDMANACWSGKKIVNPPSPSEDLKRLTNRFEWTDDFIAGVQAAVKAISQDPKHAEVKDWLDGDGS
jgi:hypothetical protein